MGRPSTRRESRRGRRHPSFTLMQTWTKLLGVSIDMFDSGNFKKAAE
jgi:hypothetical protein